MSGYRRFLPRDGTQTTAHAVAEVAEAAEVKAVQGVHAAETLLKPAEVRSRDVALQQASAELQQPQTPRIPQLQQLQQLQQALGPKITETQDTEASHAGPQGNAARAGIPAGWCAGVLRLSAMPPPRDYPEHAWRQLIVDAKRFLDGWAAQAHRLGWPVWELFGCCRLAPWGRVQGMGLVLLLRGRELSALTQTEAVVRTPTGVRQTYHCKSRDPLHPAERCLVWELS